MRTIAAYRGSVIVDNLNAVRSLDAPSETDAKLSVDPDAKLSAPIALESFESANDRITDRRGGGASLEYNGYRYTWQ